MSVCGGGEWWLRPEKEAGSHQLHQAHSTVIGSYEATDIGVRNWTQLLWKSSRCSYMMIQFSSTPTTITIFKRKVFLWNLYITYTFNQLKHDSLKCQHLGLRIKQQLTLIEPCMPCALWHHISQVSYLWWFEWEQPLQPTCLNALSQ